MSKSPFPGMDPYLEDVWCEVHQSLMVYARDQLRQILPQGLRARLVQRVFALDDAEMVQHPNHQYVAVGKNGSEPAASWGSLSSSDHHDLSTPIAIEIAHEPITQTYLEIRDVAADGKVISAIAFLSPAQKNTPEGRDLYLARQREYRATGASIVEIDLTRRGDRYNVIVPRPIPAKIRAVSSYLATVWRAKAPTKASIYSILLSQRLPVVHVPLREGEEDAALALQPLIDLAYENGDYEEVINYRLPLDPPLLENEAAWVDGWLRGRGRR